MAQAFSEDAIGNVLVVPARSTWVGPLLVRAEASEVERFRQEASAQTSDGGVPFTFPVRWFTHPEIRAAGAAQLGDGAPWVPIHESQSFDYGRPLEIDTTYRMLVEILHEAEPARLVLRAEISPERGTDICLRAEMVLRIIRANQESTP